MKLNKTNTLSDWHFWIKWTVPVLLVAAIQIIQLFPLWIEQMYSRGWYIGISIVLRNITGWIHFSIGDIMYILFGFSLLFKLIKGVVLVIKRQFSWAQFGHSISKIIRGSLWLYIWFIVLWGFNYSRLGIAHQLKLQHQEYCKEEVVVLTNQLIVKMNELRRELKDPVLPQPTLHHIFEEAENSYENISSDFSFLSYHSPSVKSSLYSPLGNYFGFTGYYNPFTGEAQVRNDVPRILIPYIVCHEMAHQLGYASESEANFVGYLSSSSSKDIYFRYSVYLDMFSYAQGEEIKMFLLDRDINGLKTVLKENKKNLDSLVRKDRKEIREFFHKRENKISPMVSNVYDQYLKMNKQLAGINSYNEIIGWLLAYQKKYGKL
jgi:hypothetical protein